MSGGSCNVGQAASSAASDLDNSRVSEETREAARQQRENQAANRILQCPVCRIAFTDVEAFKNHACDHSFEKTLNCFDCGKLFKTHWGLTRHLRTHGEPFYVCGVCGKIFPTKDGHETHMFLFHAGAQD
ncbi:zinc finger protein 121-like [Dermacentor albipictus]|uniref:zinc finger protein 121-like n=1 Tax=Dermacentor albipictus TaxID=60249 RepID=UPI0038FCA94D